MPDDAQLASETNVHNGTSFDGVSAAESTGIFSASAKSRFQRYGRRAIGLLLLGITVFFWTATNFLTSTIFADSTYSKPYLVTYINTAIFILPLSTALMDKACRNPEALRRERDAIWDKFVRRRNKAKLDDDGSDALLRADSPEPDAMMSSQTLLLGDPMESSQVLLRGSPTLDSPNGQLSFKETAKLSLEFCVLWFMANYFVSACLEFTTVASATILTSTSSIFTLIFGSIFKVERFTLRKLLGVLISIAGIALISTVDYGGASSDDKHRGDFPEKTPREIAIGNLLALISAMFYGIYASHLKRRVEDESRVNMQLFFGFVGLANILILWPGFIILHFTGFEVFELPPTRKVTIILLCNALGSLFADLCWAYAVLMTSPIVVTVGLSMTIPLSLVGQMVINSQSSGLLYWIGALAVVLSFIFVNHEEKKEEEEVVARLSMDRDTSAGQAPTEAVF